MISAHAQCATSQSVSHTDVAFYFITFLAFYLSHVSDFATASVLKAVRRTPSKVGRLDA